MKSDFKLPYASILLFMLLCNFQAFAQEWTLRLTGEVKSPVTYTQKEFASLPQSKVVGIDHDGKQVEYEGVSLYNLLVKGGVPLGDSLRGKNLLLYLQAEALDGYKVVYALPEIDTLFTNRTILVADKKNGGELNEKEGPLQIIVPGENKHARWIRQLKSLRILRSKE